MTTFKLILLRVYNVTLGRSSACGRWLRKLLLKKMIYSKANREKYAATSRYFNLSELDAFEKD